RVYTEDTGESAHGSQELGSLVTDYIPELGRWFFPKGRTEPGHGVFLDERWNGVLNVEMSDMQQTSIFHLYSPEIARRPFGTGMHMNASCTSPEEQSVWFRRTFGIFGSNRTLPLTERY
ncbi:hypothetical protein T265_14262, partial [Opisthorchis viverrini]